MDRFSFDNLKLMKFRFVVFCFEINKKGNGQ